MLLYMYIYIYRERERDRVIYVIYNLSYGDEFFDASFQFAHQVSRFSELASKSSSHPYICAFIDIKSLIFYLFY